MKKSILVATLAFATTVGLASCGGAPKTYTMKVDDPVLRVPEARNGGFLISFTESKALDSFQPQDFHFSVNNSNMTFSMGAFNAHDLTKCTWYAKTSVAGEYKVSLDIAGLKPTNDLTLTVREGQYADTDIVLPENIRITYKSTDRYDTEQSNDIYKIGSRYVLAHDNVPERYYIVNPNKSMYTFMYNKDGGVWRNRRERDADQYDNLMNNLLRGIMNDETDEYVSKEASNVTIGGVEYDSTKYTYVLSDDIVHTYNWINTTDFAFAATTERHYPFKYLTTVTAIDQTVTQFPAEFNLPE